jgi:hypothetical protein
MSFNTTRRNSRLLRILNTIREIKETSERKYKGKGKGHPRTGHEDPEGE